MSRPYTPLLFLAALGAGGISIVPFAFLQFTWYTGPGLVKLADVQHSALPGGQSALFYGLEGLMLVFITLHAALSLWLLGGLVRWMRTGAHTALMDDPIANSGVLAPFISLFMTLNVIIGPVRFFVPGMAENLQALMLPGLIGWILPWSFLMLTEIRLLRTSFEKSFDLNKIHFGWLLHPFALAMASVTGAGIAAMAKNPDIAHTAAFLSAISATMGAFLLVVKLNSVFTSHFAADGLPARQFLPSFLIVIPNITLFAITAYRLGHYLEHHHGAELGAYFTGVVVLAFAFETWYLLFGLSLLANYFRREFFTREFYVSQWGLVCPFVAYAILSVFTFKAFVATPIFTGAALLFVAVAVGLFALLLRRQLGCSGVLGQGRVECT
ncbi:MAG: hypothetical protein JXX28_19385 [Deltaproteobacteria bacterium]|nr:hypothetical protein [Deltaproteobacteria bacterium]